MNRSENIKTILSGEEISLKDLWRLFWVRRRIVIICAIIFGIIGVIAAVTSPKEYEAKCVLLVEQNNNAGASSLAGLAGLAGISMPAQNGADDISTDLYPIILKSQPFLAELGKDTVFSVEHNKRETLSEYFSKGVKSNAIAKVKGAIFGLPGTIKGWFSKAPAPAKVIKVQPNEPGQNNLTDVTKVVTLTGADQVAIGNLMGRILLKQEARQVTLTVRMPEAELSAEATKLVLAKLIKYVTKYKTGKQQETVDFLEARTAEASANYRNSQLRVASFKDNNYGVIFQSVQSKEQQLQNEFSLAFNVYNQLATQLEQAKIQLKKETPLFSVLEPVYMPGGPSSPNMLKIVLMYVFAGVFIGFVIALYRILANK